MKETLKRDLNKTYLILSSEETEYQESYELQMIVRNSPETLLPLHILRVDEELQLFFDISSKQSLESCAEREKLSAETIRRLFQTIDQVMKDVKDYLLDLECIVLDLAHIYTKEGKFFFCYCPWKKQELLKSFRSMLEEILGKLDYRDTEGVEFAYHLYQNACKGNLQITEILKEHYREEEKTPLYPESEEFLREQAEESIFEEVSKEQKKTLKEKGILKKIVRFFMKKESLNKERDREKFAFEQRQRASFSEKDVLPKSYNAMESDEGNTVLMEEIDVRSWKLQPLSVEYPVLYVQGSCFVIGKKRGAVDGYIERNTISRIHSRLAVRNGRLFVADANSTNGTFVNGEEIEPGKEREIFSGDRILFADVAYECYNSL